MTWKGTITLMCDLHFMKRRLIFVLGPFDRWGQGQAAVSIWILGFVSLWGDLFLLDRFPGQLVQIYERSFQAAEEKTIHAMSLPSKTSNWVPLSVPASGLRVTIVSRVLMLEFDFPSNAVQFELRRAIYQIGLQPHKMQLYRHIPRLSSNLSFNIYA